MIALSRKRKESQGKNKLSSNKIETTSENINGIEPTAVDRKWDPERLLQGYFHSAATLNYLRALSKDRPASRRVSSSRVTHSGRVCECGVLPKPLFSSEPDKERSQKKCAYEGIPPKPEIQDEQNL
eukprot:4022456-Amphidinium_carterae.1